MTVRAEWYVILNMNCKYEICRMCPKSGLFKGSYEECEKWIKQKQKEEKKDEIKNKISMALKDPILQQGFEIICKENAELKKKCYKKAVKDYCKLEEENEQLRNNGFTVSAMTEQQLKVALEKGEQLEKENAELRKDKEELCHSISEGGKACVYLNGQLTKAKDLLKEFVQHYEAKTIYVEDMQDLLEQAKQFLKDSEVEK